MTAAKLLFSRLRTRNSCGFAPVRNQSNRLGSLRDTIRESRVSYRSLSSATIPIAQRRRKRGRGQQSIATPFSWTPHFAALAGASDQLFRRQFSSTCLVMDKSENHSSNEDQDDNIGNLEKQLDRLLEGGSGSFHYPNVWKMPPSSRESSGESGKDSFATAHFLHPLDSDKRLDRLSRFLLELLQTLQQVGLTNTNDRVTTERCNAILNELATGSSNNNSIKKGSVNSFIDPWQRIERAKAILKSMESYLPLQEDSSRGQIPMEVPLPSHETYFLVLKLYSSAKQLTQWELDRVVVVAEPHTMGLLEAAQEAPLAAKAIVERMQDSGDLALVPTSLHWNQVLSCYANAVRRPNRPLEAATLLYELLQQRSNNKPPVDASSFAHVLRACSDASVLEDYCETFHPYSNTRDEPPHSSITDLWKEREAFAKLALAVAERVWKGLQQEQDLRRERKNSDVDASPKQRDHLSGLLEDSDNFPRNAPNTSSRSRDNAIAMNSHHFVHMLKAGRNFATPIYLQEHNLPTMEWHDLSELRRKHEKWMRSVFEECCHHQKVNIHVLREIMYQGAVLVTDESGVDGKPQDSHADWVERVVLPREVNDSTQVDLARFRSRWEKEILPSLRGKSNAKESESETGNDRRLEHVYGRAMKQTRMLIKCLPSRWRARAD